MATSRVLRYTLASALLALSLVGMSGYSASAATCIGNDGVDDTISCSDNNDYMDGLGGDDNLSGLAGDDEIHGSNGRDYLRGNNNVDNMCGTVGNDTVIGDSGNDTLRDTNANDSDYMCGLAGSSDEIWINDGDGNDILWDGSGGTFHIDGGDTTNISDTSCP